MIIQILLIISASVAAITFLAAAELRRELQMLQQNSYRLSRYARWLRGDLASVNRVTEAAMLAVIVVFRHHSWLWLYALAGVGALALFKAVKLLRTKYKKPLVFTARATRLYVVGLAVLLAAVPFAVLADMAWLPMALTVASPLVIALSLTVLTPVERLINRRYVNDARRILRSMPRLKVVGITGSYGKTSTKHYLHRILSERYSVAMTPGSFNTTLGVVRTVREHLRPYDEVFIVEMGAKQPGDIAEICELVHPTMGIITAVGEQHLESFKTVENVQRTKFELVDALPVGGVAILNDDFEYIRGRAVENVSRVVRYSAEGASVDGGERVRITDVRYGRAESSFALDGGEPFTTRLVGRHNISNLAVAIVAARELGLADAEIRHAVASIEQVEHRLEVKRTVGGVTILDDAFNSNPHGAAAALEVLAAFTDGRRIVVTPGMIELGARQEHHNRELGRQMAAACDTAVVVGEYNRAAIMAGLAEGGFPADGIYAARDFADASAHVRGIVRAGDTILYENDLPDTFK
jgi:UDP-N-acetylmuramoyl-tripeptide--D-alanyl-D-alanine ligase